MSQGGTSVTASSLGAITTITGNTGGAQSPSGGNFNFLTSNSTVVFAGTSATETLNFGITNLVLGSSLSSLAGGTTNVGLGQGALQAITSGSGNIGIGFTAGASISSGLRNIAIADCLNSCSIGTDNVAIGFNSLNAVTSGSSNIAIGQGALQRATSDANVAIGYTALTQLISGIDSVAIGYAALSNTTGNANTSVGSRALTAATGCSNCTVLGAAAGINLLTGTDNILIGVQSGFNYTSSESSNILIGSAGVISESNSIRIGTQGSGSAQQNRIFAAGIAGTTVVGNLVNVSSTGQLAELAAGTTGQVLTGVTGASPVWAAPTTGISWNDVTGATQTLAVQNGYVTDRGAGVTYTLPASATLGAVIKIVGKLGIATITPNANQQILIGSSSGAVGVTGTAVANNVGDCIELICITAGASTVWRAASVVGTWTLTT